MAMPPRSIALSPANAPESLPMGVRADPTITEPGMVASCDVPLAGQLLVKCGSV